MKTYLIDNRKLIIVSAFIIILLGLSIFIGISTSAATQNVSLQECFETYDEANERGLELLNATIGLDLGFLNAIDFTIEECNNSEGFMPVFY